MDIPEDVIPKDVWDAAQKAFSLAMGSAPPGDVVSMIDMAARAILADRAQMSEWKDMATAPRDGTSVLVVEDGVYFVAWWQNGAWGRSGDDYNLWVEPTHWWPLPPYPTTPNQTGEVDRT